MSVCFHLPSVTCEYCAHLEKSSAKSPWVGVVTTGGTFLGSWDITDKMRQLTMERDEAREQLQAQRDNMNRQHLAQLERASQAEKERDEALARIEKLEAALRWYVEHDDTHNTEYNEPWLEGKREAMRLLGMEEQ